MRFIKILTTSVTYIITTQSSPIIRRSDHTNWPINSGSSRQCEPTEERYSLRRMTASRHRTKFSPGRGQIDQAKQGRTHSIFTPVTLPSGTTIMTGKLNFSAKLAPMREKLDLNGVDWWMRTPPSTTLRMSCQPNGRIRARRWAHTQGTSQGKTVVQA